MTTTARDALEYVPIADIAVDANIRRNTKITQSWVSSIRNHGILNPAIGWRDEDGTIHLTDGQRRHLAAIDIGLTDMPVIIKPKALAEEARVLTQLTLNEQREGLDDSEHMSAIEELASFGVTATMIARKTNQPKARIDQALAVAGNPTAAASIEKHQLTLDQAAIIVEFSHDPAAVTELETTATEHPTQFEHIAQRIRDDHADELVKNELRATITAAGAIEIGAFYNEQHVEAINYLWRADDPTKERLTTDDLGSYTDIVAHLTQGWRRDENRGWAIQWGIRNWKAQGLTSSSGGGTTSGPLTDDEKAARKAKREAKAAMTSATLVRRLWLHDHLFHNRLLSFEYRWTALAAVGAPGTLKTDDPSALALAAELLGIIVPDGAPRYVDGHYMSPTREALIIEAEGHLPARVALAIAIAHTEGVVGNPKADSYGQDPRTAIYLIQLEVWGYTLAPVEEAIVNSAAKDAA